MLFRRNSLDFIEAERVFVNWKLLFTAISLISNPYPTAKALKTYFIKLEGAVDPETFLISEEKYLNVSIF